jgi:hypothetical protein
VYQEFDEDEEFEDEDFEVELLPRTKVAARITKRAQIRTFCIVVEVNKRIGRRCE